MSGDWYEDAWHDEPFYDFDIPENREEMAWWDYVEARTTEAEAEGVQMLAQSVPSRYGRPFRPVHMIRVKGGML